MEVSENGDLPPQCQFLTGNMLSTIKSWGHFQAKPRSGTMAIYRHVFYLCL